MKKLDGSVHPSAGRAYSESSKEPTLPSRSAGVMNDAGARLWSPGHTKSE